MSNLTVRLGREDRLVDLLERLESLTPGAGDVVLVEAACGHEIFSHPVFFRIVMHRWPQAKFVAVGLDGCPQRLAAGLGVVYTSSVSHTPNSHQALARESLLAHNFTFWEYLVYELKRKAKRLRAPWGKGSRESARWHQWIFPGLVFFGVATLLVVLGSYVFVTRTVVTLTPQVVTRTATANVTFVQEADLLTVRAVPVRVVEQTAILSQTFLVAGIDEANTVRAQGWVEIVNETGTGLRLRPSTRLIAPEGQVFRLPQWTDLPADKTVRIRVVSDVADGAGRTVGTGANIASGTLLALPGLGDLRDKVWARTVQDFTGATQEKTPFFTQKDYNTSIDALREKLMILATDEVAHRLERENINNPVANWAVLPAGGSVTVTGFTGTTDTATGAHVTQVSFSGSISVRVLTYDRTTAEVYLKTALFDRLLADQERFVALQPTSLRIAYELARTADPFRLRATVEMDTSIAYTLMDISGNRSLALRQEIAGKTITEASSFLLNNPQIAGVSITSSPFWAQGVAEDPAHIRFVIARP